jgi:hypothetical protein
MHNLNVLAAKYIIGECKSIDINGPENKVKCIAEALKASRQLYVALQDDSTNLSNVLSLIKIKNDAAQEFKKVTGQNWYF